MKCNAPSPLQDEGAFVVPPAFAAGFSGGLLWMVTASCRSPYDSVSVSLRRRPARECFPGQPGWIWLLCLPARTVRRFSGRGSSYLSPGRSLVNSIIPRQDKLSRDVSARFLRLLSRDACWQGNHIVIYRPIVTPIAQDECHSPEGDFSYTSIFSREGVIKTKSRSPVA